MADSKDEGNFTVRYTNRDIMDKLEALFLKSESIHKEVKKTNGRVTHLEKHSFGSWISKNPFKFALFTTVFLLLLISDFRNEIVAFLLKFV